MFGVLPIPYWIQLLALKLQRISLKNILIFAGRFEKKKCTNGELMFMENQHKHDIFRDNLGRDRHDD